MFPVFKEVIAYREYMYTHNVIKVMQFTYTNYYGGAEERMNYSP